MASARAGLQALERTSYRVAIVELPLAGMSPEAWLTAALSLRRGLSVIFVGQSVAEAVRCLRGGASDYVESGEKAFLLAASMGPLLTPAPEPWRRLLIGDSPVMRPVLDMIRLLGPRRSSVLITGETGTGKEVVARAIHAASPRAREAMVSVNCTALPEALLEAELFGHVKGAYTGAFQARKGRFEEADRGTIFLDEIGDMPVETQAKLLRVLQESGELIKLDVRVVSATNANLEEKIDRGKFREDLFYRLNVVPLHLPPLRDRAEDVAPLLAHFIEKVCRAEAVPGKRISPDAMERLEQYAWPGNVRQLENTVERAVAMSGERQMLHYGDFSLPLKTPPLVTAAPVTESVEVVPTEIDFAATVQRLERTLIDQALRRANGNKKQAADLLRLKRTTLNAKLKSLEEVA
ncbi:MAG: sigma-54 dependent transcriptional regulator [Acidobacteria bacterium]|nr:sigma-54 dependent transcriptional regulator [Acidobacteriota bacterium]